MVIRYFEVTSVDNGRCSVACEYFGDFGAWAMNNAKFAFQKKINGQFWVVFSDHKITSGMVDGLCEQLANKKPDMWLVDLASASNPVSKRTPAMKKKPKGKT